MDPTIQLPLGYEIRTLSNKEFNPLWENYAPTIFDNKSQIFRLYKYLSNEEKDKVTTLKNQMGTPIHLNLVLYFEGQLAGWCAGHQESSETFYMRNSAILPDHRQKGLYTALMSYTINEMTKVGFQKIYSKHSATNNDIIIPKLKFGFKISSIEISDLFGVLVHLVYFPKNLRQKMLTYRAGDIKPDEEIKNCLGI